MLKKVYALTTTVTEFDVMEKVRNKEAETKKFEHGYLSGYPLELKYYSMPHFHKVHTKSYGRKFKIIMI